MAFNTLFLNLLTWLVQFVLFVPFQFLKLASFLMPPCSQFGITSFSQDVSLSLVNWIRFLWPVIQFVPWVFVWNFVSCVILYVFFRWLWAHLPKFISLVMNFWWIFVIFFVLAGVINIFTSYNWTSNTAFTQVFGSSATGTSGAGFGGGGGGSW